MEEKMALPDYIIRASERKAHPYHMWDGITAIESTLASIRDTYKNDGIAAIAEKLAGKESMYFVGCGTSYYDGLAAQFLFNRIAGMNVTAMYALEFAEFPPLNLKNCAVVGVSHTGGTASVIGALAKAKEGGAYTLGITDVEGSNISAAVDTVLPCFGGREPSLPKTRSYLAALMKIYYLAAAVGRARGRNCDDFLAELETIPEKAGSFLKKTEEPVKALAENAYKNVYLFGSGFNLGSVSEAALKLQETAQLVTVPFELEEGMHGPWVTMNKGDLVAVLHFDGLYHKKSRELIRSLSHIGMDLLVIGNAPPDGENIKCYIPVEEKECMSPFFTVMPFYQLAYLIALKKGNNPDFMRLWEEPYLATRLSLPR
jgi:glucosamine--fructose-6-phosphate aminotransferase (isomerizing)